MEATIITSVISAALLFALATVWNQNKQLHKNQETLKQELEKSKKVIQFLSDRNNQTAIKPEFLASLGIPVLQEFNYHLANLYKKIFLLDLLEEAPQTVHSIGQYIKLIHNLESSEEKEYLLKNFAITLFSLRYQTISSLINNALIINPEDNSDGQIVINFILTNLALIQSNSTIENITYVLTLFINKRNSFLAKNDVVTERIKEVIKIMENCKSKNSEQ